MDISGGVCGGVIISTGSQRLKNGVEHSLMAFIRAITAKAGCSSGIMMGWSIHWSNKINYKEEKNMLNPN